LSCSSSAAEKTCITFNIHTDCSTLAVQQKDTDFTECLIRILSLFWDYSLNLQQPRRTIITEHFVVYEFFVFAIHYF